MVPDRQRFVEPPAPAPASGPSPEPAFPSPSDPALRHRTIWTRRPGERWRKHSSHYSTIDSAKMYCRVSAAMKRTMREARRPDGYHVACCPTGSSPVTIATDFVRQMKAMNCCPVRIATAARNLFGLTRAEVATMRLPRVPQSPSGKSPAVDLGDLASESGRTVIQARCEIEARCWGLNATEAQLFLEIELRRHDLFAQWVDVIGIHPETTELFAKYSSTWLAEWEAFTARAAVAIHDDDRAALADVERATNDWKNAVCDRHFAVSRHLQSMHVAAGAGGRPYAVGRQELN
jgi:hypothetical protein